MWTAFLVVERAATFTVQNLNYHYTSSYRLVLKLAGAALDLCQPYLSCLPRIQRGKINTDTSLFSPTIYLPACLPTRQGIRSHDRAGAGKSPPTWSGLQFSNALRLIISTFFPCTVLYLLPSFPPFLPRSLTHSWTPSPVTARPWYSEVPTRLRPRKQPSRLLFRSQTVIF